MTLGPTDVHTMAWLVKGSSANTANTADRVRFFSVRQLRETGCVVTSTPTANNPLHVSVAAPVEGLTEIRAWQSVDGARLAGLAHTRLTIGELGRATPGG